jgi:3-deoxy-D-manno-octulosonate 8-phosphate phosphatase (KDO 8-P phosphatase)
VDFKQINLLVLDVDGVLTDGAITYSESGAAVKSFHVHDGLAIKLWQRAGRRVAILSSRESPVVKRRATELGVSEVLQGEEDKASGFAALLQRLHAVEGEVCYVGDDFPDLAPMRACGFPVAVANAAPAVKQTAAYVTHRCGGSGAVAEVVELILRKQGLWRPGDRS